MMWGISATILLKEVVRCLSYFWFNEICWDFLLESTDIESILFKFQLMLRAVVYTLRKLPHCQIHVYDHLCTLCIITHILDFIL